MYKMIDKDPNDYISNILIHQKNYINGEKQMMRKRHGGKQRTVYKKIDRKMYYLPISSIR